ncbi:hypothetical protein CMV_021934 [Castanea mollissima]|uniref:Wall-associated receptor kinase galacturonan-binding domain-containing protein n=1 Tax=Castanea mollissima TaxID=60419 RepID=A0A8J4QV58_9ROSI|nr:hypothetical protein CMV_021934 [Castanea mollissima]
MARGLTFTAGVLTALIAVVLVQETCSDAAEVNDHHCPPSSCGNIHNISYPFRLKSDPEICGDSRYELSCENNRTTVLYLFARKYHVQEINYNNYTIRVVDSGIWKDNYFSFPSDSLNRYNFSQYRSAYTTYLLKLTAHSIVTELSRSVVLMSCEKPVLNSLFYLDASTCNIDSGEDFKKRYRYVKVGRRTNASDVEDSCKVEQMFPTSWPGNDDPVNTSCTDVHNELLYGFELSWLLI